MIHHLNNGPNGNNDANGDNGFNSDNNANGDNGENRSNGDNGNIGANGDNDDLKETMMIHRLNNGPIGANVATVAIGVIVAIGTIV